MSLISDAFLILRTHIRMGIRSVFMRQDHFGYNSVQLGITWYNSVQLRLILF